MKYKTHLVGGLLTGGIVTSNFNINTNPIVNAVFISGAIIGSLFPDIDHRGSYVGRKAKIISTITSSLFGHRGITHSPIVMGIFVLALFFISRLFTTSILVKLWLSGFYTGILSHIFLDMITKGGVPLLFPFSKEKISLTKIKTGSMGETVIMLAMAIICVCIFTNNNIFPQLVGLK